MAKAKAETRAARAKAKAKARAKVAKGLYEIRTHLRPETATIATSQDISQETAQSPTQPRPGPGRSSSSSSGSVPQVRPGASQRKQHRAEQIHHQDRDG